MQAFGPPYEGPLRTLVDSHIETYGGQHRVSAQSTAGSLYPRGGPMLVSPGCAPKVTWVGQEEGHPSFQVSAFYRFVGCSIPIPHPTFFPGLGERGRPCWAMLPGLHTHPRQMGHWWQRARRSQALRGGAVRQV